MVQPLESRRRFAPQIGLGPVEIWDVAAKTGRDTNIEALNWRMSWFADGERLVYAQTNPSGQPVPVKILNLGSGNSAAWPTRFPMAVSTEGRTALINMGRDGYSKMDIAAEILATGMLYEPGPALLVDLGTNGEIALKCGDKLIACATAAGGL